MYKGPYIINPFEEYRLKYLPAFQKKADDIFEKNAGLAGVDPEVSKKQNLFINELEEKKKKSQHKLTVLMLRFLLMLFAVAILSSISFVFIEEAELDDLFFLLIVPICGVPLFLLIKNMGPEIINLFRESSGYKKEIQKSEKESISYLTPLAEKLTSVELMQAAIDTIPPIQPDLYLTSEREQALNQKFNFKSSADNENESVIGLLTGTLGASPFILRELYICHMENVTYTGSTGISWTETETYIDEKGKECTRNVTRTQTLTASVTRPAPAYQSNWQLSVMNDRAASVCFTHRPPMLNCLRRNTPLRNPSVEDSCQILKLRDVSGDAVEYGIMFNPLAVNALYTLETDQEYGYGDDFTITKDGPLLNVSSKHFEGFELNSPVRPNTDWYDYDSLKQEFWASSKEYFRSLYFAFAPVLAFDIYQRFEPVAKHKIRNDHETQLSDIEIEHIMNRLLGYDSCICKIGSLQKCFGCWEITADLHTFECANYTEVFSVAGDDGKSHAVEVHYNEFYPKTDQTKIYIRTGMDNISVEDINQMNFPFLQDVWNLDVRSRILSFRANNYSKEDDAELSNLVIKLNTKGGYKNG